MPNIWPRYVKSLPVLLKEHLCLDDDDLNLVWVRDRDQAIDEQVWLQRPLTTELADVIVKDVAFLQDLHLCYREKLMRDAYRGAEGFAGLHRDSREDDLKILKEQNHLLPPDFPRRVADGRRKPGFWSLPAVFRMKADMFGTEYMGKCKQTITHTSKLASDAALCRRNKE